LRAIRTSWVTINDFAFSLGETKFPRLVWRFFLWGISFSRCYFVFPGFCEVYKIPRRTCNDGRTKGDGLAMKRTWDTDELIEQWTLMPPELELGHPVVTG